MDSGDLFIAGLIVFLVVTVVFAAQKRYVVFFDGTDLLVSVCPWLLIPCILFFFRVFGLSQTFETILFGLATILTVICFIASFVMCGAYNRSIPAGLFVGLFKLVFAAVFGILLFIGILFDALNDKKNRDVNVCLFYYSFPTRVTVIMN